MESLMIMIIMVNSLVAAHSLIDVNDRKKFLLDILQSTTCKRSVNNDY
jgi:hypothetical protein